MVPHMLRGITPVEGALFGFTGRMKYAFITGGKCISVSYFENAKRLELKRQFPVVPNEKWSFTSGLKTSIFKPIHCHPLLRFTVCKVVLVMNIVEILLT